MCKILLIVIMKEMCVCVYWKVMMNKKIMVMIILIMKIMKMIMNKINENVYY